MGCQGFESQRCVSPEETEHKDVLVLTGCP